MATRVFEWSDLRIFLAIVREGTLGAAARALGSSQPTMGRRLRALEAAIGAPLLQRSSDGFVLTDEGAATLLYADRVEAEMQALERRLAANTSGVLRVTSSDWFGATVLTPVVEEYCRLQPDVEVELLTDARVYNLARREADISFRIVPFREPEVVSRRLMQVDYGVYVKKGTPAPRADGAGTRLVTMNTAFEDMPDAVWLRQRLPRATIAARSNNRDVQAQLCAQGVGVAVLPRLLGDAVRGLRRIDLGEAPPGRDTFVGYHRDLRALKRLRAFVDLVVRRTSGMRD